MFLATARIAASISEGGGEAKTEPMAAAASMPLPTYPGSREQPIRLSGAGGTGLGWGGVEVGWWWWW